MSTVDVTINQLDELASGSMASGDVFPIYDISETAAEPTKKVEIDSLTTYFQSALSFNDNYYLQINNGQNINGNTIASSLKGTNVISGSPFSSPASFTLPTPSSYLNGMVIHFIYGSTGSTFSVNGITPSDLSTTTQYSTLTVAHIQRGVSTFLWVVVAQTGTWT